MYTEIGSINVSSDVERFILIKINKKCQVWEISLQTQWKKETHNDIICIHQCKLVNLS